MSTVQTNRIQHSSGTGNNIILSADGDTQVNSLNGGQLAGFRNQIINGLGGNVVNQRGFSSGTASVSVNQYTVDRWRLVNIGDTFSWTNTTPFDFVFNVAGELEQVIESLAPGQYTLSWTGTATAQIAGGGDGFDPIANGGQFTVPVSGFSGRFDATVRFGNGTISSVQLEPGPVATPFEHRPIGVEKMLCARYFQALEGNPTFTKRNDDPSMGLRALSLARPVVMRAVPTETGTLTSGGELNFLQPTKSVLNAEASAASVNATVRLTNYTADAEL